MPPCNRRTLTQAVLVAALAVTIPWAVMAQESGSANSQPDLFTRFDLDNDGTITKSEFPGSPDRFALMDNNGDGVLSRDEVSAGSGKTLAQSETSKRGPGSGPPVPGGRGFDRDDADGDGKVSKAEFSGPSDLFAKMDANGDGYLTKDEAKPPEGGPGGGPGGPPPGFSGS